MGRRSVPTNTAVTRARVSSVGSPPVEWISWASTMLVRLNAWAQVRTWRRCPSLASLR